MFVETAGASFRPVQTEEGTFQIDFDKLEAALTEHTKGILVNSPNNPSGVIFPEAAVQKLAELLREKSEAYGHPIYLIADEPYRELAYGKDVPYLTKYYDNTLVCYSYSKSLSLPGRFVSDTYWCRMIWKQGDMYAAKRNFSGKGAPWDMCALPACFSM